MTNIFSNFSPNHVKSCEFDIESDKIIEALIIAQELRPERYTILKEKIMTKKTALNLAKSTKVI